MKGRLLANILLFIGIALAQSRPVLSQNNQILQPETGRLFKISARKTIGRTRTIFVSPRIIAG